MSSELFNSERLKEAFNQILKDSEDKFIIELSELLCSQIILRSQIDEILTKYNVDYNLDKEKHVNLLLSYMEIVLDDDILTQEELLCLKQFKRVFNIKEGDFYKYRYDAIGRIMLTQLYKLYIDRKIDNNEALHKVALQELFDLSYDQFNEFDLVDVEIALENGADILDLDTFVSNYSKRKEKN